jgi:hypothetical protein
MSGYGIDGDGGARVLVLRAIVGEAVVQLVVVGELSHDEQVIEILVVNSGRSNDRRRSHPRTGTGVLRLYMIPLEFNNLGQTSSHQRLTLSRVHAW